MTRHDCLACTCETPEERGARLEAERRQRERTEREQRLAQRWGVLTDDDRAWAAEQMARGAT